MKMNSTKEIADMEHWKEIRPVTAGMFARGVYPVDKPFFMTSRFDLAEEVNADAVKTAWKKTLAVYPHLGYSVAVRGGRLVLLENPLPFVVEETSETIVPYGKSGNFHTVTFCHFGRVLWIYADHVPFDGSGFERALETFFYYYYCAADGCEYPIPEGVMTEKDGPVPGQETDAYLMEEAVPPSDSNIFEADYACFALESPHRVDTFVPKELCRGYFLAVPSGELMRYAKSVKGSPLSVLTVCLAKAVERVHPDNRLPIRVFFPASVRNVMGNTNSLLHQVVHTTYSFPADALKAQDDVTLNRDFRAHWKDFTSEKNIRKMCGVYRGICEANAEAFASGDLGRIVLEQRTRSVPFPAVSYLGTLRTGAYGKQIRMKSFHIRQEMGIMVQTTEVGGVFCVDWYQGFPGDWYIKAMRDVMREVGIGGISLERVE